MSPQQQGYLQFLRAWQAAYDADYATAIPQLNRIADSARDPALRFRAGMASVNVLAIARRYGEAYARLSQMIELLPGVTDRAARQQGLAVAAFLYERAGQYDLALRYAGQLIDDEPRGHGNCTGRNLRLQTLYVSGKLKDFVEEFQDGIDACDVAGEPIWANRTRMDVAKLYLSENKPIQAAELLKAHYGEAQRTNYAELTSEYDAVLALAYEAEGQPQLARQYAQGAVAKSIKGQITEALVDAYRVQYEVARSQGDLAAGMDWLEKYSAADKGYLDDTSAHALAYQMVSQQVEAHRQRSAALEKENQVLQLRQQVDAKTALTGKLLILLLATVLASIALYAYRTKRSQLKFQKLARRDGLTEIFNRQYFVEAAEQELAYCRRSVRDVSVVAIDLDHFKQINDSHGHAAGDFALRRAVAACQKHLRSVDIFGRLGGEEFGILMPDCVPERAAEVAEKMRAEIASLRASKEGPEFAVSASFGVTAARWSGYDLLQLLAQADSALYQAKREGRDRVVMHGGAPGAVTDGPRPGMPQETTA